MLLAAVDAEHNARPGQAEIIVDSGPHQNLRQRVYFQGLVGLKERHPGRLVLADPYAVTCLRQASAVLGAGHNVVVPTFGELDFGRPFLVVRRQVLVAGRQENLLDAPVRLVQLAAQQKLCFRRPIEFDPELNLGSLNHFEVPARHGAALHCGVLRRRRSTSNF